MKDKTYHIGSDNDTADTVRTTLMGEAAQYIAKVFKRTIWPREYERTFEVDGVIVEVRVREKEQVSG
jgi:hypothetical protein